ncbi:MAG: hypothetical protein BWK78_09975 [Thiotrichaceae bacterium IS1]|nr:MAG: hypothetical protein BWK78_09975 [Thiotrichaceae bacterium IS1]
MSIRRSASSDLNELPQVNRHEVALDAERPHCITTRSGQRYAQVFMYLIYKDFNKSGHLRSFVINQSVIEVPQDLCIRLTAERGNETKGSVMHQSIEIKLSFCDPRKE